MALPEDSDVRFAWLTGTVCSPAYERRHYGPDERGAIDETVVGRIDDSGRKGRDDG